MYYNNLGKSGLKVSALSFGSWITFGGVLDLDHVKTCMKEAFDHGVNFFDNAEVYANGESEKLMGEAIKDYRREDLVISTKIFWGGEGPNDVGLSHKHLMEGTKNSLKRLQLDYVDLLFCHRPDGNTPMEETVRAMDMIIRSGMAFYWGTSEWSAEQIEQAHHCAREIHAIPPSMEQPEYNLFRRDKVEEEFLPLYDKYGMGTTIWSPLAQGLLTGKYQNSIAAGTRFEAHPHLKQMLNDEVKSKVAALLVIAEELGCSLTQLSLAWCLKNRHVSTVITGSTTVEQIRENMKAIEIVGKLDDAIMSEINSI